MMLALSSTGSTLAIIGLVVGLVVFGVVVGLLQGTLKPLLAVLADVKFAKTAPMLEHGVPGTDQLGQTRRLADSVPPLALAYLAKLGANPAPPPPPPAYSAPRYGLPAAPAGPAPRQGLDAPVSPAWRNRT